MGTKWRTLALATAAFNLSFLVWFSFAPFTGPIADEFGLSTSDVGILASAAVWGVVPGRIVVGWLSDRYGAPSVFGALLVGVGLASVASALATSYGTFFVARLVVALAGVSFVVGVQHVAQWFPDEQLGTAQGIYAGVGNAGAAGSALILPRAFGGWSGPIVDAGWRAAFVAVGVAAVVMGVAYWVIGDAAPTDERAATASEAATLRGLFHTASRYGVLVLSLGYLVSFGLEISMNGWLPTYFRELFGADLVLAGTVAAAFALGVGTVRPISGYLSDRVARGAHDLLPGVEGHHRTQYTAVCVSTVVVGLVGLTLAGRSGSLTLAALAVFLLGAASGATSGAIFAQVPAMVPGRAGAAAGVVGGIGTVGGLGFPLVYAHMAGIGFAHEGYLVVAVVALPVLLLHGVLCRPETAERARTDGLVDPPTDD